MAPKRPMLTAATISDSHIAAVIDLANEMLRYAHSALDRSRAGRKARKEGLARCAEIINASHSQAKGAIARSR